MDQLGLKRYCCRRMVMTHVDLIEKLLKYDRPPNYRINPSNQSAYANGLADITLRSATLAKLRSIIRILWLVLAFTQWGMVEHSQNGKAFLKTVEGIDTSDRKW